MCALFGFYDLNSILPPKVKKKLLRTLSIFSLVRGRDACGMAYVSNGDLRVFKIGKPANKVKFYFPDKTKVITGHNRASTIGDPHKAENAHPFKISVGDRSIALSHNGVLFGIEHLRLKYGLPNTTIETDSVVAAQLLNKFGDLSMKSLADMAEAVSGSFTFTILDNESNLYFIKGDSPLSIAYYEELCLWVYASTTDILSKALIKSGLGGLKPTIINLKGGDIFKIGNDGDVEQGAFKAHSYSSWFPLGYLYRPYYDASDLSELIELGSVVSVNEDDIRALYRQGFELYEIEELIEEPELLREQLKQAHADYEDPDFYGEFYD
jgi:glucosamine--fructose-6-phosphate aminotransferase (isomerizing)